MLTIPKPIRSLALAAGIVVMPTAAAFAQQNAPQIAVPTPPPGGGQQSVEGCYSISQNLYGPYRMSFCLNRGGGGSYQVTGQLYCNGTVDWQRQWNGQLRVNIHYSWCQGGMNWSADTMICTVQAPQWPPFQPNAGPGNRPQIAVPVPQPGPQSLTCAYYPGEYGYQPMWVNAQKTW